MAEPESLTLPKRVRTYLTVLLLALAVVHLIFPNAADATSLGLVLAAIGIQVFEIEGIDVFGLKTRGIRKELEAAREGLRSAGPALVPPAPSVGRQHPAVERRLVSHHMTGRQRVRRVRVNWLPRMLEQVRRELIVLAGNSGSLPLPQRSWEAYSLNEVARSLVANGVFPGSVATALEAIANHPLANGPGSRASTELAVTVEDVGRHIAEIPRDYIRVVDGSVEVFCDPDLVRRHDRRGVMLEHITPEEPSGGHVVYPTRDELLDGSFVSWEWDVDVVLHAPGWYHDSETGEAKQGWTESVLFVGRSYPKEWGIQERGVDRH